jgi:2-polyprenyl-3-methyl-5-hydroxy-6-metoxy-1,4-benzoquinol methylase
MSTLTSLLTRLSRDPTDAAFLSQLRARCEQPDSEIHPHLEHEDALCHEALTTLFSRPAMRARWLIRLAAAQVRARHRLDESRRIDAALLADLASDPLCLSLLSETLNTDVALERAWTRVRRECLLALPVGTESQPLLAALALQAWNNEYLWNETVEEAAEVASQTKVIEAAFEADDLSAATVPILRWSLYRPLARLSFAEDLAKRPLADIPLALHRLWQRTLLAPREEAVLLGAVPKLGRIQDAASRAAQAQNEENPYPRWLHLSGAQKSVLEQIRAHVPKFTWPATFSAPLSILVAGCGTGKHPLSLAVANPDAEVLALDLSAASLGYAQRMARDLGIDNVRFVQADLLELPALERKFHHIECVGVLHELGDQQAAWKALTAVLHAGGTLRVGVTSKVACLPLAHLRTRVLKEGVSRTLDSVRAFRERLLQETNSATVLAPIRTMDDFFSVSMVRHLLFPTSGHQYTLAELEQRATDCGLRLLGYRLPRQVRRHVARPSGARSFAQWRTLETAYAGSFGLLLCLLQLPDH